jgi:hypothetical protein
VHPANSKAEAIDIEIASVPNVDPLNPICRIFSPPFLWNTVQQNVSPRSMDKVNWRAGSPCGEQLKYVVSPETMCTSYTCPV